MYINLVLAVIAVAGALTLLTNVRPPQRSRIDIPGTLTVSAGLFALVYGFSHAETTSWGNHLTVGSLVTGAGLLFAFAVLQARTRHPLLPPRVVTDRNRAASFLSVGIAGAAMFAVFLFLTYYLQQNPGYSPITTGAAFLPMTVTIVVTSMVAMTKLQTLVGPRPLVVVGMLLGGAGMAMLTGLGLHASYVADIMPALLVMGVGIGLAMSTSMSNATLGVAASDAGVASATVSASQQIGGSIGTALLSTIASSAFTSAMAGSAPTRVALAHASVHGYTVAFGWAAGIFVVGAVVAGVLFRHGRVVVVAEGAAPAFAH